ncbi:MAG TPA: hypothetical protein VIH49_00045 [Solirubrobacteraceae bacterium]
MWRANGDHCETIAEQVNETLVPIEPECVERFDKHTCENLGGALIEHGTVIGGSEETPGLTRRPNAETLTNGDIAIFRDLEAELTDKELPDTTRVPENFAHSPSVPSVPTPEPAAEPLPPRSLPAIPPELGQYIGSVDPGLGHSGPGTAVPSPIDVNRLTAILAASNPESGLEEKEEREIAKGCLQSSANAGEQASLTAKRCRSSGRAAMCPPPRTTT